jgi:hypothetical protein
VSAVLYEQYLNFICKTGHAKNPFFSFLQLSLRIELGMQILCTASVEHISAQRGNTAYSEKSASTTLKNRKQTRCTDFVTSRQVRLETG